MQERRTVWLRTALVACALVASSGAASAQTTTSTETIKFTVVSVDGNRVVVNEQGGAKEYTVPEDFRFSVGGSQISVRELKPGMTGTATITTTTTVKPMSTTEVRQAEVIQASGSSIIVRGQNGFQMFTEGDVEKRGIHIMKDGKPVRFSDLSTGDRLTATIITPGEPQVLTEREVQARLAEPPPAAVAQAQAPPPAATPAAAPSAVATEIPTAEATGSALMTVGIIGAIVLLAGAVWMFTRRRQGA